MKKLTLTFLLTLVAVAAPAQEIFKLVRDGAARAVNNPTNGIAVTMIAQFKLTTLNYIESKARNFAPTPAAADSLLDNQAYYLSEFIDLYIDEIVKKMPKDEKRKRIILFMDASKSNPLFGDTDTELIDSYMKDGDQLTPFCIDTDWERALAAAKYGLGELDKQKE